MTPPPRCESALARAALLLTAHGRGRDAITLVERALRARSDPETVMLLALLLLGTGDRRDWRRAHVHLRRLQWRAPARERATRPPPGD
ncbi:MAG: hypothetical protein KF819_04550 [Labilithrix sp.]|nr:hypothetical protein [Labilithrix sp.]